MKSLSWLVLAAALAAAAQSEHSRQGATPEPDAALTRQLEKLRSTDPVERARAADALRAMGPRAAAAIPALISNLGDSRPLIVFGIIVAPGENKTTPGQEAARALAAMGRPALPPLLEALKGGTSAHKRANAAFALDLLAQSGVRDSNALEPLLEALKAPNAEVRKRSAEALGSYADPGALEPLLDAAQDFEPEVRASALRALAPYPDPRPPKLLLQGIREINETVSKSAIEAYARHLVLVKMIKKPPPLDPLLAALQDSSRRTRANCLQVFYFTALNRFESDSYQFPEAVPAVIQMLGDRDPSVRLLAATVLKEIGDKRAVLPLIETLKDQDGGVRKEAARALGGLYDLRAVDGLIAMLDDPDPDVRGQAVTSLGLVTGEYFGGSAAQWRAWWEKRKAASRRRKR